ncbi:hypothetical protein ACJDUH_10280 [Clostridium sp. WILCCON 0202]|uniref:Transposase DDE domain-containing protein n=1 Tax=Candidatus Clostridium radicumherbarum TaxID=3381662 RepID=A0ABW8TU17_9CLOT
MANMGMHNEFKKTPGFNRYKYLILLDIKKIKIIMYLTANNNNAKTLINFIFAGAKFMLKLMPINKSTKISNNKMR